MRATPIAGAAAPTMSDVLGTPGDAGALAGLGTLNDLAGTP